MQKYLVPSLPHNLFRKSLLITQIDNAFDRGANFIFIKAPAGYGKTYLMLDYAQYLSSKDCIAVWFKFESEYDSVEDYFSSFIDLLKSSRLLATNFFYDENISLYKLMNTILEQLESSNKTLYFFMDDFHSLNQEEVNDALQQFLLNDIENIKIFLTSRIELPFPTGKAYINDQIYKITHQDLAFTAEEVKEYSTKLLRRTLSIEESETIVEKTGGWPAVLFLSNDDFHFDTNFQELKYNQANSNLAEFLSQEVIVNLSKEEREHLLILSVSKYLCEPLIKILIDNENLKLSELENIPLLKVDNPLLPTHFKWFVFQPLLKDYLQFSLKSNNKNLYLLLHAKAAHWYFEQEVYVEAVEHFIKAEEFNQAIEILSTNGINIIASGNFPRFKRLIQKLPYKYLVSNASLLMLQGWFYTLNYQHSSAVDVVNSMKKMLSEHPHVESEFKHHIIGLEGAIAHFSDELYLCVEPIEQSLQDKPLTSEYVENSLRSLLAFHYLQTDQFSELDRLKNESLYFSKGGSLFFSAIYLFIAFAMKEFAQGNIKECLKLCIETEAFIKSWCNETRLGHIVNVIKGMVAYVQGDLLEAKACFDESGKTACYVSDPSLLAWYYPLHLKLLADLGLQVQQEELIDDFLLLCHSRKLSISICPLIYEVISYHLKLNHVDDALVLYHNYKKDLSKANYGENNHLYSNEEMLDSLVLGFQGKTELQQNLLLNLVNKYEQSDRLIQQVTCLVALVNSAIETKNTSLAKQKLKQVVTLASSQSLVQLLSLLHPEAISYLSQWTLSEWSPKRKSFMADVCERFAQESTAQPLTTFQIEPLTQSEKKVMDLLALGYSNKVIAEKLSVSINTIKFHLKVVFSKLGVSNRIQANLVYAQNKNLFEE